MNRFILPASYALGTTRDSYGIPISWISDLFQSDFWDLYVRAFGIDAVKVYPRLLRSVSTYNGQRGDPGFHMAFGPDYEKWRAAGGVVDEVMGGAVPAEEWRKLVEEKEVERVREAWRQAEIVDARVRAFWARSGNTTVAEC